MSNFFSRALLKKGKVGKLSAKTALLFVVLQYAQSGISLLCSVALTRIYSEKDFGIYAYGMVFFSIISSLGMYGFDRSLVRDLVHKGIPNAYMRAALIVMLIVSIVLVSICVLASYLSGITQVDLLIIAAFSVAGLTWALFPSGWFDYKGEMYKQSLVLLLDRLAFFAFIVYIWFTEGASYPIENIVYVFLFLRVVSLLVGFLMLKKQLSPSEVPVLQLTQKLFWDNRWSFGTVLISFGFTQINQLVLKARCGLYEFTVFFVAMQMVTIIRLLLRQIQRLYLKSIADATQNKTGKQLIGAMNKMVLGYFQRLAFIVLPLIFLADPVCLLLYGGKYPEAAWVLRFLLVWIYFYGASMLISQYAYGLNLDKWMMKNTIVLSILSLLFTYFLAPYTGAIGLAIMLIVANWLLTGFVYWRVLDQVKHQRQLD